VVANDYLYNIIGRLATRNDYKFHYTDNYIHIETCKLKWKTDSEFENYNDSSNLTYKANCSHNNTIEYYSFKVKRRLRIPLKVFDPAANQNISYTEDTVSGHTDMLCVYHINIRMTEEMHEHLQGVVVINSRDPENLSYCNPFPLKYNITTCQPKCNCYQETTEQTEQTMYLMTSSSCKAMVERMLPLFCFLMCIFFVKVFNNRC
jgi:hypothetical protein